MKYPCIRYEKEDIDIEYADDSNYSMRDMYSIMLISKDPDIDIPYKLLTLPLSSFDRRYVSDNLYHDVFTIYY